MNAALWRKNLNESKWLFLTCAAGIFAFCWARLWIISGLDTSRFKAILELLPEEWQKFSPVDFDWMITYAGRVALTFDEPIVVLCVTVWAITRGSDVISGEIGRGTMEMLLSQPVSRSKVLWTHTAVTMLGAVALAAIAWLGVFVGIQTTTVTETAQPNLFAIPGIVEVPNWLAEPEEIVTPMSEKLTADIFFVAAVNLFCLTMALHGVTVLVSSWDRYRWRTIGIVVAFYVLSVMAKLLGMSSDTMFWMKGVSIFSAYEPQAFVFVADRRPDELYALWRVDPNGNFLTFSPFVWSGMLLAIAAACQGLAAWIFVRRDIPAPL
ncbi:MAG: ABC transporter permease [bacterium]|nr:ABC transporter permease [bacterium]